MLHRPRLRRLPGEPKSPLTPGERAVLHALLPTPHASIEMDNKNHEDFQAARKALGKALKAEYRGRLFNLNGLYLLGPIGISVLAIGAAAFLDGGPLVWIGYAVAVVALHILFAFLMRAPTPAGRLFTLGEHWSCSAALVASEVLERPVGWNVCEGYLHRDVFMVPDHDGPVQAVADAKRTSATCSLSRSPISATRSSSRMASASVMPRSV